MTREALDGRGKQKCCRPTCPFKSIRGMKRGQRLCPYHWCEAMYGTAYAKQCHPDHADRKDNNG